MGTMTVMPIGGEIKIERIIVLERHQRPECMPGWKPLTKHPSEPAVEWAMPLPIFLLPRAA
jgi:hypothetical protein